MLSLAGVSLGRRGPWLVGYGPAALAARQTPVISQASGTLNLASDISIRGDSQTYMLIKPARFVTTAPTWRTYLWMDYSAPPMPNKILLPTTQTEATAWNNSIAIGWHQGLEQANNIFNLNLNRLKRDINGANI